jgi:hypothetical protein
VPLEQETDVKPTSTVSEKNGRKRLFDVLNSILSFAEQKRLLHGNSDRVKQAWSRIAISAIATYGSILRDSELDDISSRLDILEAEKTIQERNR